MNAIEMKGIIKRYPFITAVDNIDFDLKKGETHALLGENGAGKTTLMKVLYGMTKPDAGKIIVDGNDTEIKSTMDAINLGIGMVHQHFMLSPVMTVTENIIVGEEHSSSIFINYKKAAKEIQDMIDLYDFRLRASKKVESLTVGEQQRVEILKALYRNAKILILDEPTAVLTPQEVKDLFKVMKELKESGKSIILITHKLKEIMECADRVTVLRDGKMIASGIDIKDTTSGDLAKMMIGRDVKPSVKRRDRPKNDVCFGVSNLNLQIKNEPKLIDINFSIKRGEILGIAGVEGNGQTELVEVLCGLRRPKSMELKKHSKIINGNAKVFLRNKIGHIPEDRTTRGLVAEMNVSENLILGYHNSPKYKSSLFFNTKKIKDFSSKAIKDFKIKTPGDQTKVNTLSGGNQQKIVVARVFSQNPDVIIVAQPTRGIDIGAMEYIHNRLLELRDEGKAILLISADLDEVRKLSDRIGVMYMGRIVATIEATEFDERKIGLLMAGTMEDGAC